MVTLSRIAAQCECDGGGYSKNPLTSSSRATEKMTDCNQQATTQSLKGDDRKKFMSQCLKAQVHPDEKALTPQQQKMKNCNAEAATKELKGDARKTFMSTCLKKAA